MLIYGPLLYVKLDYTNVKYIEYLHGKYFLMCVADGL